MPSLACHDYDVALASLADTIGTTPGNLAIALGECDESRLENRAEDPWVLMPRDVLEQFGADVEALTGRFDGAFYFHGTRAVDPEAFNRRGILPLDTMVEELWATLRALAGEEITDEDWDSFPGSVETGAGGRDVDPTGSRR